MRRMRALVAVLALAFALTACAGIPTGGSVNEGRALGGDVDPPDVSLIPDPPKPGGTPAEIVDGFLRAGSGPAGNWARAKEFLAPGTQWRPDAGVTIDVLGTRTTRELDDDTVTVVASQVARVDDKGSYERVEAGTTSLTFELAEQPDGEWRITYAPDGIVLDRSLFPSVFSAYPLSYFDPDWEYLVPDVRWFPRSLVASRIVAALVNGPSSDWLAASVNSAFPEGVEAAPSAPVSAGVATVELSADALSVDQQTWDRMQTQLEESLRAAGVNEVRMVVGTTLLAAEPAPVRRTTVAGQALVKTADGFGFLSAAELTPIPGLSAEIADLDAVSVQVSPDRGAAAVLLADGTAWRVPAVGQHVLLDDRAGLVAPTIDPHGVVWTVPHDEPHALRAHLPDGREAQVGEAWPEATRIEAMAVSRDGTRLAALVTAGGRTVVLVSGIVRGSGESGWLLGPPIQVSTPAGTGRGIAWLDDTTLGVLTGEQESTSVAEQLVGGPGSTTAGPAGAVSIAGGSTLATTRLRDSEGTLYVRRGSNWQEIADGVLVLATQQGMPE